ncbi:MAG TPA: hypothetical protein VH113_02305, partial [Gemmatimonadales bacterium]|nr:hypothetical protein [Gemmatimonadales bacterium]
TMMAATLEPGPTPVVRGRAALFDAADLAPASPHANWDIAPDGTRFVVANQAPLTSVIYVLGWTEEVRRRQSAKP